jgi:hypothetical protein
MIRLWKSFCMVFLFVVAMTLPAISEELKTVTSEGVAAIQGNARDIARNAAIEDAQRRAVEQAIGSLMDSRTQVENYQLISDKILSQTKGYIKQYTVAGETTDSGLLRVSINAEVALGRLTDDLSGIGIRISRGQKLRSVNITITGLNETQFAKFKDVLLKQLRGIKDLQERSFSGITAKISVYSKNSTQTLSDEIRLRDFGAFSVEVMSSTANSLELKVTPKQ